MKTTIVLACSGIIALTGCMREYDLTRDVPRVRRNEVNARLLGETWTIENLDGTSAKGKITSVDPDSMTYVEEGSGREKTIAAGNIATIRSSPGMGGPILGFIGGGIMGGMLGLVVGGSQQTSHDVGGVIEGTAQTLSGFAVGVIVGAPVGLLAGSEITAGEEYIYNRVGSEGGDTAIVINREDLTAQTRTSVTFRWGGRSRIVPQSVAEIQDQGEKIRIILPRIYLRR